METAIHRTPRRTLDLSSERWERKGNRSIRQASLRLWPDVLSHWKFSAFLVGLGKRGPAIGLRWPPLFHDRPGDILHFQENRREPRSGKPDEAPGLRRKGGPFGRLYHKHDQEKYKDKVRPPDSKHLPPRRRTIAHTPDVHPDPPVRQAIRLSPGLGRSTVFPVVYTIRIASSDCPSGDHCGP